MDSPLGILAELTYRCPLACAYCSNPVNLADYADELATGEWRRVLAEAADLGVLQCHLSGGEPLLRRDLVDIVSAAHDLGLYTNLVTSAVGLSRARAEQLRPPKACGGGQGARLGHRRAAGHLLGERLGLGLPGECLQCLDRYMLQRQSQAIGQGLQAGLAMLVRAAGQPDQFVLLSAVGGQALLQQRLQFVHRTTAPAAEPGNQANRHGHSRCEPKGRVAQHARRCGSTARLTASRSLRSLAPFPRFFFARRRS